MPRARRFLPTSALAAALVACGACGGDDAKVPGGSPSSSAAPVLPGPGDGPPGATPPGTATPSEPGPGPGPSPSPPPTGLACLARHYVGTPVSTATGWSLRLPDATELAWDDAKAKTFDERLAAPDLEDTLSMPYPRGPIVAVNAVDEDPGRIRSDALFKATFGATSPAVQAKLVDVDFVGQTVKLHTRAAAALGKVSARLQQLIAQKPSLGAFVSGDLGGTFVWRPIANTNRLSAHSYGIAIDIVVGKSNYWEWEKTPSGQFTWKNQIPQAIVDAFEAEGFAWGGRWYHYDTMHFEYRPELFDPACKP